MSKVKKAKNVLIPKSFIKEASLFTLLLQGEPLLMQYLAFGFEGVDQQALGALVGSAFILVARLVVKFKDA